MKTAIILLTIAFAVSIYFNFKTSKITLITDNTFAGYDVICHGNTISILESESTKENRRKMADKFLRGEKPDSLEILGDSQVSGCNPKSLGNGVYIYQF